MFNLNFTFRLYNETRSYFSRKKSLITVYISKNKSISIIKINERSV